MNTSTVINDIKFQYNRLWDSADPRVAHWPLMSSPMPNLVILTLYLYAVKQGPSWMKNREPFKLRGLLVVYNLGLVILSGYLVREFMLSGWAVGYTLGCQPVDYSTDTLAVRMATTCWLYYISKLIELSDTMFFIMRKKFNQVSHLHVFHHFILPLFWWFGVKFIPGGLGTFHATLNSAVHFMMYTYYALSAIGPSMQPYLWWKRYMTKIQIIQFLFILVHTSQVFITDCDYSLPFSIYIALVTLIVLALFIDFYLKTYKKSTLKSH